MEKVSKVWARSQGIIRFVLWGRILSSAFQAVSKKTSGEYGNGFLLKVVKSFSSERTCISSPTKKGDRDAREGAFPAPHENLQHPPPQRGRGLRRGCEVMSPEYGSESPSHPLTVWS